MGKISETLARHRSATFCVITFVISWLFWAITIYPTAIPDLFSGTNPLANQTTTFLMAFSMLFPAFGVVLTRLVSKEGFKYTWIAPKDFKKTWKYYAIGWFGPIALVAFGATVYFLIDPGDFDPSLSGYIETTRAQAAELGQDLPMSDEQLKLMGYASLPLMLIAPALNCVACFGEEWGWRGYLLPKLIERHTSTYAIIVGGIIWGLWHAPIIVLGHNYGLGYPGWPVLGILAMCIFTVFAGAFLSWLTLRSKSCLPAVIAHGAINGCAAGPSIFAAYSTSPFIGPLPTGIIGGIGFIIVGILCIVNLRSGKFN